MEESLDKGKGSFENVMSKMDISHPRGGTEWIGDLELKIRSALKNDHNGLVSRDTVWMSVTKKNKSERRSLWKSTTFSERA